MLRCDGPSFTMSRVTFRFFHSSPKQLDPGRFVLGAVSRWHCAALPRSSLDGRKPMITPGIRIVPALLDHGPFSILREEEGMMVELVSVLHKGVIHLGAHPACPDKFAHFVGCQRKALAQPLNICRCLSRGLSFATGHSNSVSFRG